MVVQALESMQVQFGICGGAAMTLIQNECDDQIRITRDIDLIVQPDPGHGINAEVVSQRLFLSNSRLSRTTSASFFLLSASPATTVP
jgi:hypothetical protein